MNVPRPQLALAVACVLGVCMANQRAAAEPVQLPAGMTVPLELQHHVSSGYTAAGSPIYFRVARDVLINEQVLITKGALATGTMRQATNRGLVGRSGAMSLTVESVSSVDGTPVRIDADMNSQGRSRSGATAGWTIFWGLPGLITRGVNPYMEQGAELMAVVVADTAIDPANALSVPPPADLGTEVAVTQHRWYIDRVNGVKDFDIERKSEMKTVQFKLALPGDAASSESSLGTLRLLRVGDSTVPEEIRALRVEKGAAVFDAWSIARYCSDGDNRLLFTGVGADGRPFHATRNVPVRIKKKVKKEKKEKEV